MKLFRKTLALLLAAAIAFGGVGNAFADNIIIGTWTPPGEASDAADDGENNIPESGVDLSDAVYAPEDISAYTEWDGDTAFSEGTNYYINSTVKMKRKLTLPEGSRLVLCAGAELLIYGDARLRILGNMIAEPNSIIKVTGTLSIGENAGFESYGTLSVTKSAVLNISSEFIIRHGAKATISGTVNIYKTGVFLNYGQTTLTESSYTTVTGEWQTPSDGRLYCKGHFGITINGRATQAGYFLLGGEMVNSRVFIFESTVKYYKMKSARFAVSKSSRLIDYRNGTDTTGSNIGNRTDVGAKGIDVSYAQGAIDWAKVKKAGVQFAMIRASRGKAGTKPMAKDVTFDYNITEATKNGVKVGVYHYLYASTEAEAREEARFFIETISPYKITYPVVLDVEEQYQANLGKAKITSIAKVFLDEVKAAGYYAMLYSNKSWLTHYLDMSVLSEYDVWLAQWNEVPTYSGDFGMWQYSAKGIVSGIDGYVDLDLSYKNYSQIIRNGGYNRLAAQ